MLNFTCDFTCLLKILFVTFFTVVKKVTPQDCRVTFMYVKQNKDGLENNERTETYISFGSSCFLKPRSLMYL